jgi:hypothetical protein
MQPAFQFLTLRRTSSHMAAEVQSERTEWKAMETATWELETGRALSFALIESRKGSGHLCFLPSFSSFTVRASELLRR